MDPTQTGVALPLIAPPTPPIEAPQLLAPTPVVTNGSHPPVAPLGPQVRRKEEWRDVDPIDYEGFQIRVWRSFPQELHDQLLDLNFRDEEAREILFQIVREHNHWRDENSVEYPPATTHEFYKKIPTELASRIISVVLRMTQETPPSAPQRRRN